MDYNRFLGYSLAEICLILIWEPLIDWFNLNLPSNSVGDALGQFFWIILAITFMYFMAQILIQILGDF